MLKPFLSGIRRKREAVLADPAVNANCREFEVNNWALSTFVVERVAPVVGIHPFPLNELMLMAAAVCRVKPTHIFEWGTHIGKSARIFYETAKAFAIETEIHSVDLPDDIAHEEHPGQSRGLLVKGLGNVYLHFGDGLETTLNLCARLPSTAVRPLFFVDGDHAYESVRRELLGIIEQVPQASVLLHDTFNQSPESNYNTGPYRAICEVLGQHPNIFRAYEQNLGLPGMTFLWRQDAR